MDKPEVKPEFLCMAPWTHTYLSPQTERRLCCASREPAQNFEQYIDTSAGTGEYRPLTLEEHWNSEHIRRVRREMMQGNIPDECQVCNHKLLNTDVYRSYFEHLFKHKYDEIWESTDETGYTTMKPVSWDYRISNLCNFKCRMCGDMLSSSWESEQRKHDMVDWNNPKNNWMRPAIKKQVQKFQTETVAQELYDAVEENRVEEIYWVGGEPLMFEEHWRVMQRIVELNQGSNVYARYNTNLSRIEYKGVNLFRDILPNIRDWQICASIDGTGVVGEYIRTGLKWNEFLDYYKQAQAIQTNDRQMRLDFTLTLPGLFELENMFWLSKELNTQLLAKVVFAFTPDIVMSPLALPKSVLHEYVTNVLECITPHADRHQQPLVDVLENLLHRPTLEEEWGDQYVLGMEKGKRRILTLEAIREQPITMEEILKKDQAVYDWWKNIRHD
jgi:hypothetical protein